MFLSHKPNPPLGTLNPAATGWLWYYTQGEWRPKYFALANGHLYHWSDLRGSNPGRICMSKVRSVQTKVKRVQSTTVYEMQLNLGWFRPVKRVRMDRNADMSRWHLALEIAIRGGDQTVLNPPLALKSVAKQSATEAEYSVAPPSPLTLNPNPPESKSSTSPSSKEADWQRYETWLKRQSAGQQKSTRTEPQMPPAGRNAPAKICPTPKAPAKVCPTPKAPENIWSSAKGPEDISSTSTADQIKSDPIDIDWRVKQHEAKRNFFAPHVKLSTWPIQPGKTEPNVIVAEIHEIPDELKEIHSQILLASSQSASVEYV